MTTPPSLTPRRVALVTGGSRGIGRGIVEALGALGFDVAINYHRRADAAEEAAEAVRAAGGEAVTVQADVANLDDHPRLVATAVEAFGRLDLLVNNAGVAPEARVDLLDATPDSFDRVLATNLRGPYFLTQRVARTMIDLRRVGTMDSGAIVTISSISAEVASVNRGDYCVSKSGLSMLTKLFAARLADEGINVYEIRPGIIATDMTGPVRERYDALIAAGLTPIRRWGTPADVAAAVVAIAEGRLPFSTGQVIAVDGGFGVRRL